MSRHVNLHVEILIGNKWSHLRDCRIDDFDLIQWLDHRIETRIEHLPSDHNIVTNLAYINDLADLHTLSCANKQNVLWTNPDFPNGLIHATVGYFFYSSWSSFYKGGEGDWERWKALGLKEFRWIWWSIGV